MTETIKIKVWIETDINGSQCCDTFEMNKDHWEAMVEEDRETMMKDIAFDMMEWGFEIEE